MFEFCEDGKVTAWINEALTERCWKEKGVKFPLGASIIQAADEITSAE